MIKIGDKKRFVPEGFSGQTTAVDPFTGKPVPTEVTGTVCYVHPLRRYYTVEYECNGYKLRESFCMGGEE